MRSSLEIAQEAELQPIEEIARACGLRPEEFEPYGRHKGKVSLSVMERLREEPRGKLVCVAGMTPTKGGEGKTTTAIGLTQGLGAIGRRPVLCLRERRSARCLGSREGRPAEGSRRWCRWRS
jgi:formate--tetrahydrofolate ligase